jgi:hypothetical protein
MYLPKIVEDPGICDLYNRGNVDVVGFVCASCIAIFPYPLQTYWYVCTVFVANVQKYFLYYSLHAPK